MEEKPESVERAKERDKDSGNWVLRPDVSNGTSIEIASLTKADHLTPEMLELLHRLMLRVQESEAIDGPVERACPHHTSCGTYRADTCTSLESCGVYERPR